ncbi:MAG: calcium-binding EGF-like domain-containing protein [Saprospiraceae bacterium]|nr:calcium-binding EGF-like domain-containing protein [Saprospiraceae bacterium]
MKKNFNLFVAALMVCVTLFVMSCGTTDKCETVNCGANGVCVDGTCNCDAGYEGTNCSTVSRDKILGVWTVKTATCAIDSCGKILPQDSNNCPTNYKVTFGAGNTISKFTASNWASFGAIGTGTFNASTNTMTFDTMTVTSGTQVSKVIGNGIYSADSIKLNYTIISGCVKVTAQEVLKK